MLLNILFCIQNPYYATSNIQFKLQFLSLILNVYLYLIKATFSQGEIQSFDKINCLKK